MPRYRISQLSVRLKGIDPSVVQPALILLPERIAAELHGTKHAGDRRVEITPSAGPELLAGEIARQVVEQWRRRVSDEDR